MSLLLQDRATPESLTDQDGSVRPVPDAPPVLDVVIPVYNEQDGLEHCVRSLHKYLRRNLPVSFRITIADNASTDDTWAIAQILSEDLPDVTVVHLPEKGRGRALRHSWSASDAYVLAYMDVDLSTDLSAVLPLIAPLLSPSPRAAVWNWLVRSVADAVEA